MTKVSNTNSKTIPLERVFEVMGCRTQEELAKALSIEQSSVSLVKRKGKIPESWLLKLVVQKGIHPEYILKGIEPKFIGMDPKNTIIAQADALTKLKNQTEAPFKQVLSAMLHHVPLDILQNEYKRRIKHHIP